ncbi:MAG: histidine kinase [Parafilimonas sp.]
MQTDFWLNLQFRCLKLLRVFPFGIIQCYIVVYWLVPQFLLKKKYLLFIIGFLITVATEIYLVDIVTYNSFDFLPVWMGIVSYVSRAGPILYLTFFIIKMLKTWYIKQWEKDTLLKANLNAELQLLRAQVHPHFLFNTLNNIYAFILSNSPQAQELVQKLEKLLHYMINECEEPLVSLPKEIAMLNDYLELEKVRYGNRLDLQTEIQNGVENKMITPLLLIPFVENSFKHGTSKMLKEPWIKLFIQTDENVLHFSLTNSKPAEENINIKKGIGLANVKKRLELLYPQNHLLIIESTTHTFTVNLQVPIQKIEKEVVA